MSSHSRVARIALAIADSPIAKERLGLLVATIIEIADNTAAEIAVQITFVFISEIFS